MAAPAPRLVYCVEQLGMRPTDRVLEIGCGHGIAVDLVAQRLTSGQVVGLDRSEKMIAAATRRNQRHVDAGTARLVTADFERWDASGEQFDLAFAIHVRAFAEPDHPVFTTLRGVLVPGGRFAVSFQPLNRGDVDRLVNRFRLAFVANGFQDIQDNVADPGEGPVLVVTGRIPG